MADFLLADAVDATEALFQFVGVPGQIVVDHEVGALEVDALAGGVVGDHDEDILVVNEGIDGLAAIFPAHAAMDDDHGLVAAQRIADAVGEIVQRVPGFGKDDELAPVAFGVFHQGIIEDAFELFPLGIRAGAPQLSGLFLQALEGLDLGLQLDHAARRGGQVEHFFLNGLDFVFRGIVEILQLFRGQGGEHIAPGHLFPRAALQQFFLGQAVFQPLAATAQGFMDRRGAGGEATLEDLQGEADIDAPLFVLLREALGAVHLLAHVVGDLGVERRLGAGQLIVDGVSATFGKQRRAVELEQLLLGEAAHHVGGVGLVDAIAEASLETVTVQQGHEELEVLFLAVVRGGGHEQKVTAVSAQNAAKVVALGVFHLITEEGGGHAVGFVADDQIPLGRRPEPGLEVVVPAQHIESGDQQVVLLEGIAAARSLDHIAGQDVEAEPEFVGQLVLPLLDQPARRHHQASLQVAARHQLLDQEAGHDGLAGAGIIGQQKAQRLARQHLAIDGGDLVRQRLDQRRVDRQVGIEKVGKPDAQRLRSQPQQMTVPIEGPGTPCFDNGQRGLFIAENDAAADAAFLILIDDLDRLATMPFDIDDPGAARCGYAPDIGPGLKIFQSRHWVVTS